MGASSTLCATSHPSRLRIRRALYTISNALVPARLLSLAMDVCEERVLMVGWLICVQMSGGAWNLIAAAYFGPPVAVVSAAVGGAVGWVIARRNANVSNWQIAGLSASTGAVGLAATFHLTCGTRKSAITLLPIGVATVALLASAHSIYRATTTTSPPAKTEPPTSTH